MNVVCDNKKVFLSIVILGITLSLSAREQRERNAYYSEELRTIAVKANIASISDTLSDGIYYGLTIYKEKPITIIVEENEVKHIGFSVFSLEQRKGLNPLCLYCNFIERYALLLKLCAELNRTIHEKMWQDKVVFRTGNFEIIETFIGDSTLQIDYKSQNCVNFFKWSKNGKVVCELAFPSSYKLLLGMEMDELDARLKTDILETKIPAPDSIRLFSKEELVPSITHDYYIKRGSCYYFAGLNSDSYFQQMESNGNRYCLMFSAKYLKQSLANVMTTHDLPNEFMLKIKQEVYGNKDSIYTVPLMKYVSFCIKTGCAPYFCIMSDSDEIMDCELIMRNVKLQYNHVMRMKVRVKDIEKRKGFIDARLDAYVPTQYLGNLFNELQQ